MEITFTSEKIMLLAWYAICSIPRYCVFMHIFFFFGLQQICLDVNTRTVKRDIEIELGYWKHKNALIQCVRQRANCFDVR